MKRNKQTTKKKKKQQRANQIKSTFSEALKEIEKYVSFFFIFFINF